MANQYKNKVIYNGTTLIDISDTTAVQSDVASGKYFYTASGEKVEGTNSGGGGTVTWETMADQTCAITTYDGMRYVTINGYDEPLSADETYRITWGENQYICNTIADPVGFTQDGYYLGNARIFGSQYEDTGEPFVLYRTSSTRMTGATNDTASSVYVKIERQTTPSATQHNIYFEFTDNTNTTIMVYYDSTFISNAITATTPTTYGGKTVTLAELDGVEWYSYNPTEQYETLYDGTPYIESSNPNYVDISNYTYAIQSGQTYRVTWGDATYTCVSQADPGALNAYDGYFFGNGGLIGGTDTGEPFLAYRGSNTRILIGTTTAGDQFIHIKIERLVTS